MCHGESQEKGQEESQEEIVLALVNSASEKLSRSPLQIRRQCPPQAGIVVFGTRELETLR
jgi:hypothetical protein